jgi:hypothetical protein
MLVLQHIDVANATYKKDCSSATAIGFCRVLRMVPGDFGRVTGTGSQGQLWIVTDERASNDRT